MEMSTKGGPQNRVVNPHAAGRGQVWGSCGNSLQEFSKPLGIETQIWWTDMFWTTRYRPTDLARDYISLFPTQSSIPPKWCHMCCFFVLPLQVGRIARDCFIHLQCQECACMEISLPRFCLFAFARERGENWFVEWPRHCRKVFHTNMVQNLKTVKTTILVNMTLLWTRLQHSRDQNGPCGPTEVQYGSFGSAKRTGVTPDNVLCKPRVLKSLHLSET